MDPLLFVQKRLCATCIYRPESPLDIAKLEREIADPHMPGDFARWRVCHHADPASDVVCAGFWAKHRGHFTLGQIVQRLQRVQFVLVDTLKRTGKRKKA